MTWLQKSISLQPRARGFHLVTREVTGQLPELQNIRKGLAHLFLQHTSASICLNENADPDVRHDMESWFSLHVPQNEPWIRHTCEGPDDMPAHIRSTLAGCELTIPVSDGRLQLGTWQGIYLGEHRDQAGARRVLVTLWGE